MLFWNFILSYFILLICNLCFVSNVNFTSLKRFPLVLSVEYLLVIPIAARLCKLQKGCTRFATASDKIYQLLAHGRWFSQGIPASSTTKTGLHDIAEILLRVSLKHEKSINLLLTFMTIF
jgi:hypothetical protein